MKIKIRKDVIANVDGKSVRFKEGQVADVSKDAADNLVRGHYAEKFSARKPATKVKQPPKKEDKAKVKAE
jgi:hypothetical protein